MIVHNYFQGELPFTPTAARLVTKQSGVREIAPEVLKEHTLNVYVNEELTMRLTCTPEYLTELVLGRLLSEGIIHGISDITDLYLCEFGSRARVFLKRTTAEGNAADKYVDLTPSCCTGNQKFNEQFVLNREFKMLPSANWSQEQAYYCADLISEDTDLHRRTHSTHSCFLLQGCKCLFRAEDLGRHNAIDKVLGWGLCHGIDFSQTALFSSGRMPVDVVSKVIRAGIPALFSKESATTGAIEIAQEYGLTMIGRIKEREFILYTGQLSA